MKNEETNNELATVATVKQLTTASMLRAHLEEAGFTVFVQNELMSQLYGNVFEGIAIQVPTADAEEARKLLVEGGYL